MSKHSYNVIRIYRIFAALLYIFFSAVLELPVYVLGIYMALFLFVDTFVVNRLNYLSPTLAFNLPWFLIMLFSFWDISNYSRPIHGVTLDVCASAIFVFNILISPKAIPTPRSMADEYVVRFWIGVFATIYIILLFANIGLSGYVPLLRMVQTGDSGYMEFGIHGLYGFFCAYSNALGLIALYVWLKFRDKASLALYFCVILMFVLFVTRQNVISLLVESAFMYTLVKGKISKAKLVLFGAVGLIAFSILGSLRSGDIKAIAGIKGEYDWIPAPVIWIYSYCYFNILNLDNLIQVPGVPKYDFSSLASLIPSFLRPENEGVYSLEVINFNVSSYIHGLYADMGWTWVLVFTSIVAITSSIVFKQKGSVSFFRGATGATLYFCAIFSFFVNFWLYLPVIFQIFFFFVFEKLAIRRR